MKIFKIKRGDTFQIKPSLLKDDAGITVPLYDYVIISQIRDKSDVLIENLNITINLNNTFESNKVDTNTWPICDIYCDVQLTKNGYTISSETFTLRVEKDISRNV
jgi:hypothetical protein